MCREKAVTAPNCDIKAANKSHENDRFSNTMFRNDTHTYNCTHDGINFRLNLEKFLTIQFRVWLILIAASGYYAVYNFSTLKCQIWLLCGSEFCHSEVPNVATMQFRILPLWSAKSGTMQFRILPLWSAKSGYYAVQNLKILSAKSSYYAVQNFATLKCQIWVLCSS